MAHNSAAESVTNNLANKLGHVRDLVANLNKDLKAGEPKRTELDLPHSVRKDVVKELFATLTDPKIRVWVKLHQEMLFLFFDLCLFDGREQAIRDAISVYWRLTSQSQEPKAFEDALNTLLAKSEARVAAVFNAPMADAGADTWLLLSGEPPELRHARRVDQAVSAYTTVLRHCQARSGHDGKLELLFQGVMQSAFGMCGKFNRSYEFSMYSDQLRRHYLQSMDRAEHRASIMNHSEIIDAVVQTKLYQLDVATQMRQWKIAGTCLEETKNLFDTVTGEGKTIKRTQWIPFYQKSAQLFKLVDHPMLHSFAKIKEARLSYKGDAESSAIQASCAVLSVLAVPNTGVASNTTIVLSHDASRDKSATLERFLGVTIPPNRPSLITDLTQSRGSIPSLVDLAIPAVRALFQELHEVTTVDVCQKVKPHLDKIAAVPELSSYVHQIQNVAVQSMIDVMSKCFARISIPHFIQLCSFFTAADYSTRIEPLLLRSSGKVKVNIDMETNALNFVAANQQDVLGALGALADQLSATVGPCYEYKQQKEKKKTIEVPKVFTAPKLLLEQMKAERERIANKQLLAKKRLESEEERVALEKKREKERRQAEEDRLRALEAEKHKKLIAEANERQAQQIEELRGIEQRKWVITVLGQRHPGLTIDKKLAELSASAFKEEVTKIVANFIRTKADKKDSGLRDREHLERALREQEIPLVKAEAEASRESPEEREKRLAIRTEQLRKDHEAALIIKQRLAKMEAARQRYEEKILARVESSTGKMSKMDKQEELLQEERKRREREAAEEAEREFEAAAAAAAAAPKPAEAKPPATLGGGKGAWKPKSRQ